MRGSAASEAISFFHGDHLGSTSDVTNQNGALIQHTEYEPYGEESITPKTFGDTTDYLYTSKLLDRSTQLYYYGSRYYDPELGRFTQADTIVPSPSNPQSLNRYSYCDGNPINYTDPTGHSAWSKFWDKVKKAFLSEMAVFVVSFLLQGPAAFVNPATYIAATAAAVTAMALDTGEGRQLQERVGREFFDDVLGMRPSTAQKWSSVTLHMAGTMLANAGLNAMIHPNNASGNGLDRATKQQVDEASKAGNLQKARDAARSLPKAKGIDSDALLKQHIIDKEIATSATRQSSAGLLKHAYEHANLLLDTKMGYQIRNALQDYYYSLPLDVRVDAALVVDYVAKEVVEVIRYDQYYGFILDSKSTIRVYRIPYDFLEQYFESY